MSTEALLLQLDWRKLTVTSEPYMRAKLFVGGNAELRAQVEMEQRQRTQPEFAYAIMVQPGHPGVKGVG